MPKNPSFHESDREKAQIWTSIPVPVISTSPENKGGKKIGSKSSTPRVSEASLPVGAGTGAGQNNAFTNSVNSGGVASLSSKPVTVTAVTTTTTVTTSSAVPPVLDSFHFAQPQKFPSRDPLPKFKDDDV